MPPGLDDDPFLFIEVYIIDDMKAFTIYKIEQNISVLISKNVIDTILNGLFFISKKIQSTSPSK